MVDRERERERESRRGRPGKEALRSGRQNALCAWDPMDLTGEGDSDALQAGGAQYGRYVAGAEDLLATRHDFPDVTRDPAPRRLAIEKPSANESLYDWLI
jgi:hypothetical protein